VLVWYPPPPIPKETLFDKYHLFLCLFFLALLPLCLYPTLCVVLEPGFPAL
jgi:hypothetical protein